MLIMGWSHCSDGGSTRYAALHFVKIPLTLSIHKMVFYKDSTSALKYDACMEAGADIEAVDDERHCCTRCKTIRHGSSCSAREG
jgi:hypothetical protein